MVQQSKFRANISQRYLFFVDQVSILGGCVIYMLCLATWNFSWQDQLIWLVKSCDAFHLYLLLFPEHHCDHMVEINLPILLLALFTGVSSPPGPAYLNLLLRAPQPAATLPLTASLAPAGGSCFIKNIEYHIIIFPTLYAMLDQYIYSTPYCAPIIFNYFWFGMRSRWKKD